MHIETHILTYTYIHMHTYIYTYVHTHTYMHIHIYTHIYIYTCTRAHIHTQSLCVCPKISNRQGNRLQDTHTHTHTHINNLRHCYTLIQIIRNHDLYNNTIYHHHDFKVSPFFSYCCAFVFKTGSHYVALAIIELDMQSRLALNSVICGLRLLTPKCRNSSCYFEIRSFYVARAGLEFT